MSALTLAWVAFAVPAVALGASPDATPRSSAAPPVVGGGDTRSEGEGPGLVGSPVLIAAGVIALGAVTAAGTLVVLRLRGTGRG